MNKEKLEQIKKEKLEQMKELGRGGITKGLNFLRNNSGSGIQLPSTVDDETSNGTDGGSTKMSYDDLVALSMKITRQNKMMKLQFQKMQARIVELQVKEVDFDVLHTFVSETVGVDVMACRTTGSSDISANDSVSAIDARQLKERYEMVEALKTRSLTQGIEQLHIDRNDLTVPESVSLLPFSPQNVPIVSPAAKYAEIDLLNDPLPAMMSSSSCSISSQQKLDTSTRKLEQMEAALLHSNAENETLRAQCTQYTAQVEQILLEKNELQVKVHQYMALIEEANAMKDEMSDQLTQQLQQVEALISDMARQMTVEQQLRSMITELENKANATDTSEIDKLRAEMETIQTENTSLTIQIDKLATTHASRIHELEQALEATQVEKHDEPTIDVPSNVETTHGGSEMDNGLNSKTVTDTEVRDIEQINLALAKLKCNNHTLQEKLLWFEKERSKDISNAEQASEVIDVLRSELSTLVDTVKLLECEKSSLANELALIRLDLGHITSIKEGYEEELKVLRLDNATNLENVLGELTTTKQQLAEQREYMNAKITSLINELEISRKHAEEVEVQLATKETQHQKMISSQTALTNEVMELHKQVATMQQDLQMAAEGLEIHATKAERSDFRRGEMEEKVKNVNLQMNALRDQHVSDLEMIRTEKDAELQYVKQEKNVLESRLQDSEALLGDLTAQLNSAVIELDRKDVRVMQLEAQSGQLSAEIANLSVDLAETKKALSDRMALATRLQTENMGFAEKQAEQAARVENALRELMATKEAQVVANEKASQAIEEMHLMKHERDVAHSTMFRLKEELEMEKSRIVEESTIQLEKYNTAIAAEKDAFRKELDRIESDGKHKSKLALTAVLEKEAEIERLSKRLAELEEDVRSGGAENRIIFEFAQQQANREMEARISATRIQELTEELHNAHSTVKRLEYEQLRHGEELHALMQTQRREGVNMEYLKNVIVQYMSFKHGSSQQLRLVPVISTLLQFTTADLKEIKKGSRRSSWGSWGVDKPDYKSLSISRSRSSDGAMTPTSVFHPSSSSENDTQNHRISSLILPIDEVDAANPSIFSPNPNHVADF